MVVWGDNFPKFIPIASEVAYRNQRGGWGVCNLLYFCVLFLHRKSGKTIFYQNWCFQDKLSNVILFLRKFFLKVLAFHFSLTLLWWPLTLWGTGRGPWMSPLPGEPPATVLENHFPHCLICCWGKSTLNDNSNALRWLSLFASAFCPLLPL